MSEYHLEPLPAPDYTVSQAQRAAEGFMDLQRAAHRLFSRVQEVMWEDLQREYLRAHSRLPGSTRTRRLRKKRHRLVMRWWKTRAP